MTAELPPDKAECRALAKVRRQSYLTTEIECWSAAIRKHLLAWPVLADAKGVALFAPLPGEPDLLPLVPLLSGSHRLFFPRVAAGELQFVCLSDLGELQPGSFGILEPTGDKTEQTPDLCLVPGLAFDRFGTRLGFGKGYYDRFLPSGVTVVGICFENAITERLPAASHDRTMDFLVTEKAIYKTNKKPTQANLQDKRIQL